MKSIDLRLCAIVDAERSGGHDLADLARRIAEGGATLVQLRDKRSDTRAMVEEARAIKAALAAFAIPFVVNDRVDVALAAGADGVHIGPDDMTVEDARALLGPDAIIGLSIKTVDEAATAPVDTHRLCRHRRRLCDNVESSRRARRSGPLGLHILSACSGAARKSLPLCGIAGIDAGNAAAVIAAGADGVAVISALSLAPDPAAAARGLREIVDAMLAKRGT